MGGENSMTTTGDYWKTTDIHQGRIAMQGTVREVIDSELVRTIYSGAAGHDPNKP